MKTFQYFIMSYNFFEDFKLFFIITIKDLFENLFNLFKNLV